MHALTEFLYPAPAQRTAKSIIGWWERRRLAYNVFVGGAGLVTLAYASVVTMLLPGVGLGPPALILPVVFGAMANLCYFLGPATEILVEKLWGGQVLPVGPALYRMGLTFSVGLALFPALVVTIFMVARIVFSIF